MHGDAHDGCPPDPSDESFEQHHNTGSSSKSSHDPRLHVGLGEATSADIEIIWPDGEEQFVEGVEADQVLRVVQGAGGLKKVSSQ